MIHLVVGAKGIEEEREVSFDQNIVKIGRLKENDLPLPAANVSRVHCIVTFEGGEYYLSDSSSNGTVLNGELVGRNRKLPLRHGDKIEIGDFVVRLVIKDIHEEFEKTTDFLQAKFAELLAQPKAEPSIPYLLIVGGPTNGTRVELMDEMGEILMGRTPDCPVQIPSPTVSKHHARIIRRGAIIEVEDLGSANGTLVDGQPVKGVQPLKDRDEIILGQQGIADPVKVVLSVPAASIAPGPTDAPPPAAPGLPPKAQQKEEAPPTVMDPKMAPPAAPPPPQQPAASEGPAGPPAAAPAPPPPPAAPPPPTLKAAPPGEAKPAEPAKAPAAPPPEEVKTGLGALEWIIIGVGALAVIAVVVVLVIYLL
jgi:pSer/pThr/pTyr-binding forkhead associated (FHA) protein